MPVAVIAEQTAELRQIRLTRLYFFGSVTASLILFLAFVLSPIQRYVNYGTLWASGRAAIAGQNPYGVYPATNIVDFSKWGGPKAEPDLNFNPPCTLPALQLLSHLQIKPFVLAWTAASWLCLTLGAFLLFRENRMHLQGRQILWLVLSVPTLFAITSGQVYAPLFLLSALAVVFQNQKRDTLAAIAIGALVAVRPMMILWPVCLLLQTPEKVSRTVRARRSPGEQFCGSQ